MSNRAHYEIPTGLKEAQERFAEWRSSHTGRRPIPEPLWALASELARQHGVFRTAQVLRLDYTKLKRHTQAVAPGGKQPSAPAAAFVELMASASPQGCQCVIEAEGQRGRLRIEWKGPAAPDLVGLSRMLWEPGA
jgi:hypothetical protein